jgi:hypothetical protein
MAKKKRSKNRTPGKKVVKKTGKRSGRKASGPPAGAAAHAAPAADPRAEMLRAIALMRWTHDLTVRMLDSFAPAQLLHANFPGENHALWTMGHLITGYAWWAGMIDGTPAQYPPAYDALFGYKSTPTDDPAAYPHPDEVRRVFDGAWRRVMDAAHSLTDADALRPTATDSHGFAASRLEAIYKLLWHEGWHQGQLSTLRRSLGFPPLM